MSETTNAALTGIDGRLLILTSDAIAYGQGRGDLIDGAARLDEQRAELMTAVRAALTAAYEAGRTDAGTETVAHVQWKPPPNNGQNTNITGGSCPHNSVLATATTRDGGLALAAQCGDCGAEWHAGEGWVKPKAKVADCFCAASVDDDDAGCSCCGAGWGEPCRHEVKP